MTNPNTSNNGPEFSAEMQERLRQADLAAGEELVKLFGSHAVVMAQFAHERFGHDVVLPESATNLSSRPYKVIGREEAYRIYLETGSEEAF